MKALNQVSRQSIVESVVVVELCCDRPAMFLIEFKKILSRDASDVLIKGHCRVEYDMNVFCFFFFLGEIR